MKILYFLLLTLSINCLSPALLNSSEFQKQKDILLTKAINICTRRILYPFNYTFIKNYTVSTDFVLDFLPFDNFEQEVNKLNLPNDARKLIKSAKNLVSPRKRVGHSHIGKLLDLNVAWVVSTKFNTTEGSFIGFAYFEGNTLAYLKDFYEEVKKRVCRRVGCFIKCHYETYKEERNLTKVELEAAKEEAEGKIKSKLIKLLFAKMESMYNKKNIISNK